MKYTKQQEEAIDYVVMDLCELCDKPHRLFNSLIKFAAAFDKPKFVIECLKKSELKFKQNL